MAEFDAKWFESMERQIGDFLENTEFLMFHLQHLEEERAPIEVERVGRVLYHLQEWRQDCDSLRERIEECEGLTVGMYRERPAGLARSVSLGS